MIHPPPIRPILSFEHPVHDVLNVYYNLNPVTPKFLRVHPLLLREYREHVPYPDIAEEIRRDYERWTIWKWQTHFGTVYIFSDHKLKPGQWELAFNHPSGWEPK
jgi:hypothetical protein